QGTVGGAYNIDPSATPDVMSYNPTGPYAFIKSLPALQIALDQTITPTIATNALTYYTNSKTTGGFKTESAIQGNANVPPPDDGGGLPPITGKVLTLIAADTGN